MENKNGTEKTNQDFDEVTVDGTNQENQLNEESESKIADSIKSETVTTEISENIVPEEVSSKSRISEEEVLLKEKSLELDESVDDEFEFEDSELTSEVDGLTEELNLLEDEAQSRVKLAATVNSKIRGNLKFWQKPISKPSEIFSQEPEPQVQFASRSIQEIETDIQSALERKSQIEEQIKKASKDSELAEVASQEFALFASGAEGSIAWRLKTKFSEILSHIDQDIDLVVNSAEKIKLTDIGLLNRLKQSFIRRFWTSIFILVFVISAFFILRNYLETSLHDFAMFIKSIPTINFLSFVLTFWLTSFFGLIVAYYKAWSNYERNLQLAEVELDWVRNALASAQDSKHKLSKLYSHTEQWINLISLSLFNPWKTDSRWEESTGSILSDDQLPNAVSVAQAIEGSAGAMAALERTAAAKLLRPGWREQVFARQISAVAKHLGIQSGKFDYEVLDKDSPSIPNGSRNFFLENFRDESVLLSVARSYLSELSVEVQTVGLLESKPPVQNDYVDDLEVIAEDLDILGEVKPEKSWDGFLLEIVGDGKDPIIPISPLSFTDRAVIENTHGNPKVHIQMPMRLRTLIDNFDTSRVALKAHNDNAKLPLDLVVRVDMVGPVEASAMKIWNKQAEEEITRENSKDPKKSVTVCRTCGRKDCQSLEPNSNFVCEQNGV